MVKVLNNYVLIPQMSGFNKYFKNKKKMSF